MAMTENSRKVFNFLKDNAGTALTNADIAAALGVSSPTVVGSVNGLVKKGFAQREESKSMGADGKEVVIKHISLTEAGLSFDPDAVVAKAE